MCAEDAKRASINRDSISYLVCNSCGVVFPDRETPKNCPICAVVSIGVGSFVAYTEPGAKTKHQEN